MKIAAFLPAKGTSERIKNKNISLLDGEPLFLRTLKKLVSINAIDEVYLDTESDEIIDLASEVTCKILRRDPALASNKTDGNKLFMNEVLNCDADIIIQVLCTSPFIKKCTIEKAIDTLKACPEYDSVVAVKRDKMYLWTNGVPNYDINNIPNSIDLDDTVIETMSLYVMRREAALKLNRRIGDSPYLIHVDPAEAIDVNYPDEFVLAEHIAAGMRREERKLFSNIKNMLSSPALSDVLDDLGINGILSPKFSLNIKGAKIFGRARTMQIDACRDGERYEKIYDGLQLYKSVGPGDIIVVANTIPEFAFFGGLNANLAIRSGAAGAIIDGVTRDSQDTESMGFPVFSKSNYCKDVRKRGVVRSMNKPIEIDGVRIRKEDIIFGDSDGVVVIPFEMESEVIKRAIETRISETKMLGDIASGLEIDDIVAKYGFF